MRRVLLLVFVMGMIVVWASPAAAGKATHQASDVYTFADLPALIDVGDASLVRNDNGVTASATASDAPAGVHTMWWVVWNSPEDCGIPWACDEPDLFNPDADVAIGYAGGAVVGPSGKLHVAAHLREGVALSGFPAAEFNAGFGTAINDDVATMIDSRHAEVHLVLRSHGEKIPGLVSDMLHTFNGGCVYDPPIDGTEPAYGTPGDNTCVDLYFAIFPSEDTP
jgi:hypothetical protein